MTRADIALQDLHTLYSMQFELLEMLDQDLSDPRARKSARDSMKRFQELLDRADHRYMGGEDVLESLQKIPVEIDGKLRETKVTASLKKQGKK